jgi:hypothetical protein
MQSASKFTKLIISAGLLCLLSPAARADVYVICNPGLSLTDADIKDVFTGEKQAAGSTKLSPVDNKEAQDEFLQKALSVDKAKYSAQWAKRSFRDGISAPAALGGDADVVSSVKSAPGGVGYVSKDPGAGVKVLKKF